MREFLGIFGLLIMFFALLFLAYIATRFVAGKAGKVMRGKYVSVIETVGIGLDKQLHLVKAGNEYILIASAGKNIEFLTVLNMEDAPGEDKITEPKEFDFKGIFEKYAKLLKSYPQNKKTSEEKNAGSGKKFSDNLRKLNDLNIKSKKGINDEDE
ncbi:MAG TPA: flagellar biosynthetic protein FliO [Clostridia bacterium]